MPAVFFKVSKILESEILDLMESEGYTNKAEFFRFLVKFFKYNKSSKDSILEQNVSDLTQILKQLNSRGKLNKTLDEQLEDV